MTSSTHTTAELIRLCLAKLGCAPAEFAARHLYVSASVLNRLLCGQAASPSLQSLINNEARRLGILQPG